MLNENGYEIPDDTPVAVPARLRLPTSRASQIQAYIRHQLSEQAQANGAETFQEANDLDVDEFSEFGVTPYERSGEYGLDDLMALQEAQEREAAKRAPPAEPAEAPPGSSAGG